jgi:hypothetical protein
MVMTGITDENAHENEGFLRIEALAYENGLLLIPPSGDQWILVDFAVGQTYSFHKDFEDAAEYIDDCAASKYLAEVDVPAVIGKYLDEYLAERELGGGGPLAQDPPADPEDPP